MTNFSRVVEILNKARAGWEAKHHRAANLSIHNANFGWATRDQLVQSVAFGHPLIAPETMVPGEASKANLVIALRTGVTPFRQMPAGGPFLSSAEIDEIEDWISTGALPEPVPPPPPPPPPAGGNNV